MLSNVAILVILMFNHFFRTIYFYFIYVYMCVWVQCECVGARGGWKVLDLLEPELWECVS